ncbi:hypothetical protein [Flavobacterium sp. YO12]|uniref:hypothetical protein n=1 Tax=Flavobacterium sp. YO12 TaxID=1920029 RepID=UPI00100BBAE7|nr:hypothetical protein [Flavobacterium sp. YO12]RXM42585.1 hypothetical protein BOW55_20360 [Flavobacterium sp. YO12]
MKNIKTVLLLLLIIFNCQLFAQVSAKTSDGKEVVLLNDGTWKYKEVLTKGKVESTVSAGSCEQLIITKVDKMTGKSSTSSKDVLIVSKDGGKNGFGIFFLKSDKSIIMSIKAVGAGSCIDDNANMNVLFRDGTRLELKNDGKFNCDGKYTQYFGDLFGHKEEQLLFQTKEIETIRIWTSKSYVEENFTKKQSKEFMQSMECLSN